MQHVSIIELDALPVANSISTSSASAQTLKHCCSLRHTENQAYMTSDRHLHGSKPDVMLSTNGRGTLNIGVQHASRSTASCMISGSQTWYWWRIEFSYWPRVCLKGAWNEHITFFRGCSVCLERNDVNEPTLKFPLLKTRSRSEQSKAALYIQFGYVPKWSRYD